jgi:hypothetical protein
MAKKIKCDFKNCASVLTDNEPRIKCNSHCKGEFHGCCLGLNRHWSSTSTSSTTKFLLAHFICDDCIKLPDIICKFNSLWSNKFDNLNNKISDNIDMTVRKIANSDNIFEEVSGQLSSLSKSIMDLEDRSPFGSPERSLFMEIASAQASNITKIATQTAATQTDSDLGKTVFTSTDDHAVVGEWRVFNGKTIWRNDWSSHDANVAKNLHMKKPAAASNSAAKTKKKSKAKKKSNAKNRQQQGNIYDFLSNYDHFEQPQ